MKTPLILLSGFLGAGKTTLLRKLIPLLHKKNVASHVIINDYGNAVYDAETLRDMAASVEGISGSCVCCDSLDFLLAAIQQIRPTDPAAILVEVNGTTDVPSFLEVLAMSRSTRHCCPPVQVAVVDADCWQQRGDVDELEREQVAAASYIVITWQDACTPERVAEVRNDLRKLNPRHLEVTPQELANRLISQAISASFVTGVATAPKIDLAASMALHGHRHSHDDHAERYHFSAIEVPLSPTVEREALLKCLERLPKDVLRAKGMVCFPDQPESIFFAQKANHQAPLTFMQLPRTKPPTSSFVFVGAALDENGLREQLRPLMGTAGTF